MVFGKSERGSAAKPTMTSLVRARSWASAGTTAARSTPARATRVVRCMVVILLGDIVMADYTVTGPPGGL
jgi:hypothetical protein